MKNFKAKGYIVFAYTQDGLAYRQYEKEDMLKKRIEAFATSEETKKAIKTQLDEDLSFPVYDLIDGKKFVELVKSGCFMDCDGNISEIFVNGYKSNLGFASNNLTSGEFLVFIDAFEELCDEYDIKVNWANK